VNGVGWFWLDEGGNEGQTVKKIGTVRENSQESASFG
jgi:hypothetical protein